MLIAVPVPSRTGPATTPRSACSRSTARASSPSARSACSSKRAAGRRRPHAPAGPLEQAHAEAVLELAQLHADRRLGQA